MPTGIPNWIPLVAGIVSGSPTNWVNDPFPGCEKTTLFVINPRSLDDPDQISYLISI